MTVLVNDRCGGGLFLWITAVATAVVVTTGAVDDDRGDVVAVNGRGSDDRRDDGCRGDANVVMVVAIDDCRGG